eukprot:278797_1
MYVVLSFTSFTSTHHLETMSFLPLSKADIDKLEKEKREIERRRKAESERRKYFFDDKKRCLGMDTEFIQKQMNDKQSAKQKQINADKEYRNEVESFVDKLSILNADRARYYKQKSYAVGQYQKNTSKQDTDTWDLNDPQKITKDTPPRVNDTQSIPSCALQKFEGEDLNLSERIKRQQTELQTWCKQIINEKEGNKKNADECMMQYVKERDEYLQKLRDVEKETNNKRRTDCVDCANSNVTQNSEKQCREDTQRKVDQDGSKQEIDYQMNSQFLNETWDSTLRNDNEKRFIPYSFKGFSQTQRQNILNQQSKQIEDNLKYAQYLKQKDQEFHKQQEHYSRQTLLQLRNMQRLKQQRDKELAQSHAAQVTEFEQKAQQNKENDAKPDSGYFYQQFQTSTR